MKKLTVKQLINGRDIHTIIQELEQFQISATILKGRSAWIVRFETRTDKMLYKLLGSVKPRSAIKFVADSRK